MSTLATAALDYAALFDAIPCVVAVVEAESGRMRYLNADCAAVLAPGVAPGELIGVSAYELHAEHAAQWYAENVGVLRAGAPLCDLYQWGGRWYQRRVVPHGGGLVLCASADVTSRVILAHARALTLPGATRCR